MDDFCTSQEVVQEIARIHSQIDLSNEIFPENWERTLDLVKHVQQTEMEADGKGQHPKLLSSRRIYHESDICELLFDITETELTWLKDLWQAPVPREGRKEYLVLQARSSNQSIPPASNC